MAIYQWILLDHQEPSFSKFELTDEFFATAQDVEDYFPYLHECRSIVGRYAPSEISDGRIIEIIQKQQRKKYLKKLELCAVKR